MTIRPVDLQTIIPKLPEVHKAKNAEMEAEKNSLNINIHKEQQQQEKNTKQVVGTKKTEGTRINRDGQNKDKQGRQEGRNKSDHSEEKEEEQKEDKAFIRRKIDIRI
jgi:hypothetical protein